jgi:hypothetical protein
MVDWMDGWMERGREGGREGGMDLHKEANSACMYRRT